MQVRALTEYFLDSGAEGILVEGEDLSHMIWGLRQGELNSSGYRETLGAKPPNAPTRDTTQPHHYLETPSSLASSSPAFKLRENEAYQPSPPLLTPRDTEPWWHECDDNDDSPIIIPPTPQQLKNFLELQHIFESARPENATGDPGLGLFWPGPKSGPIEIDSLHRQLQASAPIFIPNSKISWQTPDLIPTSNPGATRKRSISAMDIATEYVLQKQAKNTLITPPDSTSAQWTSRFPDLSSLMSDDTLHAVVFEGQSHSRHEPVLCLDQRYTPEELLVENQATKCDVPSKDFLTNMNFNRIDDPFLNPLDPAIESYSPTFSKSGNEPLSATISTPQSPEVRIGNARTIVPQPRSVPFARLLQRRLSAVPEEESGRRMQSVSNAPSPQPLRTRRPGFQNGAQAPNKPYFAQASQNQPDISNKAPVAPSSPIPSDVRRTPRSRVLTASAVLTGFHNVGPKPPTESGSHPPSPVPDTTGSCVSKENASEKSGAAVGKGSIKKRGRNRPRKQESAGSKGSN
ncbi:hypothetical protein L218DRAFT_987714 [Marasmius fiardii PR-910]|nr:hypothetical protein L218DRAFT_987714 [Marasmius fiardii PR-910]